MNWDQFRKDLKNHVEHQIRKDRGEFDYGPFQQFISEEKAEIIAFSKERMFERCESYDDRKAYYARYGYF